MTEEQQKAVNTPQKFKRQDLRVYINLLTDFGFKRVFEIKEVMLDFLNMVLEIQQGVACLTCAKFCFSTNSKPNPLTL